MDEFWTWDDIFRSGSVRCFWSDVDQALFAQVNRYASRPSVWVAKPGDFLHRFYRSRIRGCFQKFTDTAFLYRKDRVWNSRFTSRALVKSVTPCVEAWLNNSFSYTRNNKSIYIFIKSFVTTFLIWWKNPVLYIDKRFTDLHRPLNETAVWNLSSLVTKSKDLRCTTHRRNLASFCTATHRPCMIFAASAFRQAKGSNGNYPDFLRIAFLSFIKGRLR